MARRSICWSDWTNRKRQVVFLNLLQKNTLLQYDDQQIDDAIKYLSEIFDSARLTDVRNYSVIYATKHGLEKTKEKCFRFWEEENHV